MKRIESLRRIWTPEREVEQLTANLDPQTELDSAVREYFSRIIQEAKTVTLDLSGPTHGTVNWEVVSVPNGNGTFRQQVTIWWEPDERSLLVEKLSK